MAPKQLLFSPWLFFLILPLVGAMTDAPRVFYPTERKELSDFEVPPGLIGAEREILHLGPREETTHEEVEDSHPVTYSIPFDKEHFVFENDDWDVFTLPHSNGEQMIVSKTSNITKTIMILTTIRKDLDAVLRYQIHLTAGDAPVSPSLLVFLVDNGTRVLLKEEFPEEVWRNSSIHLRTVGKSQLLFVGVLHDERNKIVLRSPTLEIAPVSFQQYDEEISSASDGEHFLTAGESPENSHGENSTFLSEYDYYDTSASDVSTQGGNETEGDNDANEATNLHPNETSDVGEDTSGNDTNTNAEDAEHDNNSDLGITTNPYGTPENGMDDSGHNQYGSDNTDTSSMLNSTSEVTQPSNNVSENEIDSPSYSNNGSEASPSTPVHLSSEDDHSADVRGVFNFFIVIMVLSFIILGIVWWRKRKGKDDDEIPVFSRNATEHGNPTFAETEESSEVGLNTETPSNYRSFR